DILVNNAGIISFKPFLELTDEDWDNTLNVNLKGQFLCARAAAKEMVKNKWGRIINIASISSGGCGIAFLMEAYRHREGANAANRKGGSDKGKVEEWLYSFPTEVPLHPPGRDKLVD
ncbi:unnamed protein product, partial [marine sediment metagenome]